MTQAKILLVNGPNLNTLGARQPEIYGTRTLEEVETRCREMAWAAGASLLSMSSNHEGALIDFLQLHADAKGAIINPGGLAHTSVVLRDAVAACAFPVVEVHISDITSREPFRRHSYLTEVTAHQVIGQGVAGYETALGWLLERIRETPS
ncbi:MAG: type II 3-dehydroquinate dehydratase [Candidatus Limnocylindria bacterium]